MAEIVGALGVPHVPMFPALAAKDPSAAFVPYFAECARRLDAMRPDLLVVFTSDHFNSFFLDNFPTFACAVAPHTSGPNDETEMPPQKLAMPETLASSIHHALVAHEFDVSYCGRIELDHSAMVPLHFLRPQADLPVLPFFINGHAPPLPRARRVYGFGRTIGEALRTWPPPLRVVLIGSGSFSLEVGGPRMAPGKLTGVPDLDWATQAHNAFKTGAASALVNAATPERLAGAGNVAGEIANWIAMAGALGDRKAQFDAAEADWGHSFMCWDAEQ